MGKNGFGGIGVRVCDVWPRAPDTALGSGRYCTYTVDPGLPPVHGYRFATLYNTRKELDMIVYLLPADAPQQESRILLPVGKSWRSGQGHAIFAFCSLQTVLRRTGRRQA
jgi:hypothetical protein